MPVRDSLLGRAHFPVVPWDLPREKVSGISASLPIPRDIQQRQRKRRREGLVLAPARWIIIHMPLAMKIRFTARESLLRSHKQSRSISGRSSALKRRGFGGWSRSEEAGVDHNSSTCILRGQRALWLGPSYEARRSQWYQKHKLRDILTDILSVYRFRCRLSAPVGICV